MLATLGLAGIFLYAVGFLGTGVFPCDYGCRPDKPTTTHQLHLLFGLTGYVFAPLILLILALAARKWPSADWLFIVGIAAAIGALAGLMTFDASSPFVGLSQRVIEASVICWIVACGLYLGLRPREV